MKTSDQILSTLFKFELLANAQKLGLVETNNRLSIDYDVLVEAIAVLNDLSIQKDDKSKKQLIAICALLWTYRKKEWDGLKDYLILFLSRAGYSPSSIMVDDGFSKVDKQFSSSDSLINQFAITIEQIAYEILVGEKLHLVSELQREIWNLIDRNQVVGVSAPTSAGKSFIILLKAIDLILKKDGNVIYIVPTLSLVSQVMMDFRQLLNEYNLDYSLESTFNASNVSLKSIYVLTQEKAIAAFSQIANPFAEVRMVVIDEIQNVERVDNAEDQRSKVLYDLITELSNSSVIDHVVISGPKIIKIDELGKSLFGKDASKSETDASPVLNLTYSISKDGRKYYFNVYSDLLESVERVEITSKDAIKGYGGVQYNEVFLGYVKNLMTSFRDDDCSLIFSPTSDQCSKIALAMREESLPGNEFQQGLSDFIASTVHPDFSLAKTIKYGIAYHHGKLPFHARMLIEDAIRQKQVKTIVSTTTLLQGVNLPVQNIIIRNPNLFIRRSDNNPKLTNYEIANLRGRAGRLLKDFVGRTFILDEQSFQEDPETQMDIFKGTGKEIRVGYGERYTEHLNKINFDLANNIGTTLENQEYAYLTTYLRQTVLRHGSNAIKYLERVGIRLTSDDFALIQNSLSNLNVPNIVCSRNRYWDPVDLDKLYQTKSKYDLPTSISEDYIANSLKAVLLQLQTDFPVYYSRYFGVENPKRKDGEISDKIIQMCILAENWMKEKSLHAIFSDSYYTSSSQIDNTIRDIQSKISYGLPLLLKPIYDMVEPEGMFTRFIELGAYLPITRKLIELNIPRETAIYLNQNHTFTDVDDKYLLIRQLRRIKPELSYWYQVQLASV